MYNFEGMIAAMPTPFNKDESIDYYGVKVLIEFFIEAGLHGVLVGGSTGEFFFLSQEERKELFKCCCEASAGRIPIIAHTGCPRTADTISLSKYADEVGASANLVLTPHFMAVNSSMIYDYYSDIAKNTKNGLIIYHFPGASGTRLSPQQVVELSKIDGLIGIKNTEDMDHTVSILILTRDNPDFHIATGYDSLAFNTLNMGGNASMGVIHNILPRQMVAMYDAIRANKIEEARELNNRLLPITTIIEGEPYPGPLKACLGLLGLPGGVPRKPIPVTSAALTEQLKCYLQDLNVL